MNEIIYLEPDEDITGVIARVKALPSKAVCLFIPRGGSIAQSVVNLKLLKREIEKLGKSISLVTKDKISKNLASQVGVTVYSDVNEAKSAKNIVNPEVETRDSADKPEGFSTAGIKINQYSREKELPEASNSDDEIAERSSDTELAEEGEINAPDNGIDDSQEDDEEAAINSQRTASQRDQMANAKPQAPRRIAAVESKVDLQKGGIPSRRKPLFILSLIFIVIVLVASVVLLPSANVKVTLATTDFDQKGEVVADKTLTEKNLEKMQIPAKEYSIEKTQEKQFDATGNKDVGTKAGGEITLYNDFDPANSISLPNGLSMTASGKTFLLDGAVVIPAAKIISLYPLKTEPGTVKGKVIAKDNGDAFNIGASKFIVNSYSGVKQEKIYGSSTSALTGGTTKSVKVVTTEDIANAKKSLDDELQTSAKSDLLALTEKDQNKPVSSSINRIEKEFTSSNKADEQVDKFTVKLTDTITELAFSEAVLKELIIDKIKSGMTGDEMLVNPADTDLKNDIAQVDIEKGQAKFSYNFLGKVGKKIDVDKIKSMLVRSKYGNAQSRIESIPGVSAAKISIEPSWWPFLPMIKQRLSVTFDYQKE